MLWKSDSFFGSNLIPKRIFLWKQVSCAKLPDLLYNFGRKSHVYSSGSFAFGAAFMFKSCCIWQQIICFLCPIYDEHFLIGILNFSAYVSSVLYSNRWIYWEKKLNWASTPVRYELIRQLHVLTKCQRECSIRSEHQIRK